MGIQNFLDHPAGAFGQGHVGFVDGYRAPLLPDGLGDGFHTVPADIHQGDRSAFSGQLQGHGFADSLRGTCDDGDFSLERHLTLPPLSRHF